MPLRGPRFSGDPVLEECFAGRHRMLAPEQGLAVKRVQAALMELGLSVGPQRDDGIFGDDTGAAVSAYKASKDPPLTPTDPVVGPGTSKALDDDLFFDPPSLDPFFGEFAPFLQEDHPEDPQNPLQHRLEPFAARELLGMLTAPLDSWRRMLAASALSMLGSGLLLGIVAKSRVIDLRPAFDRIADAEQFGGGSAAQLFDDSFVTSDPAQTVPFLSGGELRSFIWIDDSVLLGRGSIEKTEDHTHAPVTLLGALAHELTHARNLAMTQILQDTLDTDTDVYVDTALAQTSSATGGDATASVLRRFVNEIVARHVHWIVLQELGGTPGGIAVRSLAPEDLAAAVNFYFVEFFSLFRDNGYIAGINMQGDASRFPQLELWSNLCARELFSDDAGEDEQATLLFRAVAQFFAAQQIDSTVDFPRENGLYPLATDFH